MTDCPTVPRVPPPSLKICEKNVYLHTIVFSLEKKSLGEDKMVISIYLSIFSPQDKPFKKIDALCWLLFDKAMAMLGMSGPCND